MLSPQAQKALMKLGAISTDVCPTLNAQFTDEMLIEASLFALLMLMSAQEFSVEQIIRESFAGAMMSRAGIFPDTGGE